MTPIDHMHGKLSVSSNFSCRKVLIKLFPPKLLITVHALNLIIFCLNQ